MSDDEKLPRHILETAVQLKNTLKQVYITLYAHGKPATAQEIAQKLNFSRAYTSLRLNQLANMGLIKRFKEGRTVKFEIKA